MKKLVALTAITAALTVASGAEAFKSGWHAGANFAYAKSTSKQEVKDTENKSYTFSGWSPVFTAEIKKTWIDCSTYKAVDARLGWAFGKEKEETARLKEGMTAGIGFRYGTIMGETLLFGRLGLDANQQQFTYKFNGEQRKDTYFDYALAPGVGVEWEVAEGVGVEVLYQYSMSFATRGYNDQDHKFSKTPSMHHIGVGVSWAI